MGWGGGGGFPMHYRHVNFTHSKAGEKQNTQAKFCRNYAHGVHMSHLFTHAPWWMIKPMLIILSNYILTYIYVFGVHSILCYQATYHHRCHKYLCKCYQPLVSSLLNHSTLISVTVSHSIIIQGNTGVDCMPFVQH